jgi:hypothetical protein
MKRSNGTVVCTMHVLLFEQAGGKCSMNVWKSAKDFNYYKANEDVVGNQDYSTWLSTNYL